MKMKLYEITDNEHSEEIVKKLLLESDDQGELESRAENIATALNILKMEWSLLGLPTIGDEKLNKKIKKSLKISETKYLLIDNEHYS